MSCTFGCAGKLRKKKSCRLAYSIQPWAKDDADRSRGNAASTNGVTRMVYLLQAGEIVPEKGGCGQTILAAAILLLRGPEGRPDAFQGSQPGAKAAMMCTL